MRSSFFYTFFSVVFGQAEISFVTREWEDRHLADKCKYALERDVVSGVVGDLERSAVRTHLTFDAMSVGDDLFLDSLETEENDDNENEENQEDLLSFSSSSIVPATHTNKTDVLLRSVHFVHTLRSGLLSAYTIPREGDLPVDLDDDNTPPPLPRVEDEGKDEIEILDEIFNTFLQDWPLPPSSGMNVLLHMQSLLDTRCHDEVQLMYDHVQDARAREMLMRSLGSGGPTGTVGSFNAASIDVTQIEQVSKSKSDAGAMKL